MATQVRLHPQGPAPHACNHCPRAQQGPACQLRRSPRARCWQAECLLWALGKVLPCPFLASGGASNPWCSWLVDSPLCSLPRPQAAVSLCLHTTLPVWLYLLPFHKNPSHCIRPTPFQDDSALITSARTLVPNKVAFTDRGLQLQHRFWGDTIQSTTDTEHNFVFSKAVYPVGPSRRTGTENPAQGTGASNGNSPRG